MKTITGKKALEMLATLESGDKPTCKNCSHDKMTIIYNYRGSSMQLVDFSTVCQKCNDIINYELIKTYDKGL